LSRVIQGRTSTIAWPFQPDAMTPAQLAGLTLVSPWSGSAVSYLVRYTGQTHRLDAYQLRRWFSWCETNGLDPLVGLQRAYLELYIRHLRDDGLRDSSINTMLHAVGGSTGSRTSTVHGLVDVEGWVAGSSATPGSTTLTRCRVRSVL
jgi:hypothetical protein